MSDNQKSIGDMTLIALLRSPGNREVSEDAAETFCSRYMEKLMSLVGRNLASRFSPRLDPEDVVQSVFRSWFCAAKEGKIRPTSNDEIWKLLSVVALNKVRNKVKFHDAEKRAVSRTNSGELVLGPVPEPTSEDATEFMDLVQVAGQELNEFERRTLELIIEGKNVEEIAKEIGRTTKSVGRYKNKIGHKLRELLDDDLKSLPEATALEDSDD